MKEKVLTEETTDKGSSKLIKLDSKKYKFSHEYGNAYEHFKFELFDGTKWNFILGFNDIGEIQNNSLFILSTDKQERRSEKLYAKGIEYLKLLTDN